MSPPEGLVRVEVSGKLDNFVDVSKKKKKKKLVTALRSVVELNNGFTWQIRSQIVVALICFLQRLCCEWRWCMLQNRKCLL